MSMVVMNSVLDASMSTSDTFYSITIVLSVRSWVGILYHLSSAPIFSSSMIEGGEITVEDDAGPACSYAIS